MKVPIKWLENYIKIEHNYAEFGDIMTNLEFMQDGPIQEINGNPVIDLEVRQNRPDILSIIGVAREYAAFISKSVEYPSLATGISDIWIEPTNILFSEVNGPVKRFCAVEIKDIVVKDSPEWIKQNLESYGIPSINNIVDITNFVMLEYGIPLHAFDVKKLSKNKDNLQLTLRFARDHEKFETWQGTNINLDTKDLVVCDSEKPVAIAGIIGGANSDIDNTTNHILLEAAAYDQSQIRKSSIKHGIRTEASMRHEKFLNPEMVESAIRRAIFLIQENTKANVVTIEDYYPVKAEPIIINFNLLELERISGLQIPHDISQDCLKRLGFEILAHNDASNVGIDELQVKVPTWRTDVNIEADLIEEVLRLYGYDKIEPQPIKNPPADYSTPVELLLEDKLRDLCVSLGLDEQMVSPFVDKDVKNDYQVKIQNSLSDSNSALRTSLRETLRLPFETYRKAGKENIMIFEIGKVYIQRKLGDYIEERRLETLYEKGNYLRKVKPDFVAILEKLGLQNKKINVHQNKASHLTYEIDDLKFAEIYEDGYIFYIDNLKKLIRIDMIPHLSVHTSINQKIVEEMTFVLDKKVGLGHVAEGIKELSEYIKSVLHIKSYEDDKIGENKIAATLQLEFEDIQKQLTRENINEIRDSVIKYVEKHYDGFMRR